MPWRIREHQAVIQFAASARTPRLLSKAAAATGHPSYGSYMRALVIEALMRDLGISVTEASQGMPESRSTRHTMGAPVLSGPANTSEEVR